MPITVLPDGILRHLLFAGTCFTCRRGVPGRWPGEPGEQHHRLNRVACAGQRGTGMAVRLKYAGFPVEIIRIRENAPCSERYVLAGNGSTAYLTASLYCPVS